MVGSIGEARRRVTPTGEYRRFIPDLRKYSRGAVWKKSPRAGLRGTLKL
jgi:hypothetical protein